MAANLLFLLTEFVALLTGCYTASKYGVWHGVGSALLIWAFAVAWALAAREKLK